MVRAVAGGGEPSIAGRVAGMGRPNVRDGHRQRDARFVFGRRDRGCRDRRRVALFAVGVPAPTSGLGGESTRPGHRPVDADDRDRARRSGDSRRCANASPRHRFPSTRTNPQVLRRRTSGRRGPGELGVGRAAGPPRSRRRAGDADRGDAQPSRTRLRRAGGRTRCCAFSEAVRRARSRGHRAGPHRLGSRHRVRKDRRAEYCGAAFARSPRGAGLSDDARHVAQIDDRQVDGRAERTGLRNGRDDGARRSGRHRLVRVHDVAAARDVVAVADAIVRDWRPASWTE